MGQSPSQPEQAAASSPSEELRNHLLLIRPTCLCLVLLLHITDAFQVSLEKLDALIQEFNENSTDPMIYVDRETRFPGRTVNLVVFVSTHDEHFSWRKLKLTSFLPYIL